MEGHTSCEEDVADLDEDRGGGKGADMGEDNDGGGPGEGGHHCGDWDACCACGWGEVDGGGCGAGDTHVRDGVNSQSH